MQLVVHDVQLVIDESGVAIGVAGVDALSPSLNDEQVIELISALRGASTMARRKAIKAGKQ